MIKLLLHCLLAVFLMLRSEVFRSESEPDFYKADYNFTEIKAGTIEIDAQKDIPGLLSQGSAAIEKSIPDSVLKKVSGFRVQIFKTEDINEAKRRESMYANMLGDENVLLIFEKPFYKIRAGRLRDKDEAIEYQNMLLNKGINASIIVPDEVEVRIPVAGSNK
ncbi:MAG TPA: hypothetical protein PLK90_03985 [Clostridiales bacterium]|nr:hypothetical protein [Clostridiales bacterium]HQP69540.1 hypothetical protein [Clostridiales bacterium]